MTVNAPRALDASTATLNPLRVWAPALISIAIACAVFGVAFQREITGAVKVWVDSTAYNHCFLVLPLIGVLLWNRRDVLASLVPSPWLAALVLMPAVSAAWLGASLLDILEAEQLTVVVMFEILLVAVLGWRVFRALLAPLLFLFFLVPFGAFLVPALQRFTAAFAVHGLELLAIPTFADGFIIQIPEGAFEVAEACAGLRFLIASIVFGCFFATIVYDSKLRRTVFVGLSILVPILANGLRALGLILLAHLEGSAAAMEADHILYGWIFFSAVTLVLIAIGMAFADRHRDRISAAVPSPSPSRLQIGLTMTAGLVLALLGPAYLLTIERASAAPLAFAPELLAPRSGSGWVRDHRAATEWEPAVHGAARASAMTYRKGDVNVTEFVALYRLPKRGSPLTRNASGVAEPRPWRLVRSGWTTAALGKEMLAVNATKIVRQGGSQRTVWWFYVVDGQPTASILDAKLLQALAALHGGDHFAALVAFSTEAEGVRLDTATLDSFLNSVTGLRGTPAGHAG